MKNAKENQEEIINQADRNQATAHRQSQGHLDWRYELSQIQEFLERCARLGIALSDAQKKLLAQQCESAILHHTAAPERNQHGSGKFRLLDGRDYRTAYLMAERRDRQKDIYDNM